LGGTSPPSTEGRIAMDAIRRTYIVGVDASPEADQALDWTRRIAGSDDRIVVVHAWELPLVTGYDMVVTIDPSEIEQLSKQGLQEVIDRADDDRLVPVTRQGHAGRALVSEADEADAEMIVVGHRGKGRMSMMLGSTANYVLHHTARPVVVMRGEPIIPPRRIVVGVDDHDLGDGTTSEENESVRALRWAYAMPGVEEIRVVHSWFLPALAVGMFATVAAELESMDGGAKAIVDHVMAAAGPPPDGVRVVGEAVRGTPGFALIEASRDADLVVVGSRGRGGFTGLLLGSTSGEVASHSHAPVAVIR
jgi:nucleotide-binding universal stress UspA family protein